MKPIANRSYEVGLVLGIKQGRLDIITHDYSRCRDQLSAVLSVWLKGNGKETSWNFLCEALKSISQDELANLIIARKYLDTSDTSAI